MGQRFAVQMKLSAHDLRAFEAFLRRPSTTVDEACRWVKRRGYNLHRSCVYGYGCAVGAAWTGASLPGQAGKYTPLADGLAALSPREKALLAAFLESLTRGVRNQVGRDKAPSRKGK